MSPRFVSVTAMRRFSAPETQRGLDDRAALRPPGGVAHHHEAVHGRAHAMGQAAPAAARHRDLEDRAAVRAARRVDGPHPRHVQRARPRAGVDLGLEVTDVQAGQRDVFDPADADLAVAARGGDGGGLRVRGGPRRRADARDRGTSTNSVAPARTGPARAASTTRPSTRVVTIEGGPGSVGTTRPSGERACTVSPGARSVSRKPSIAA